MINFDEHVYLDCTVRMSTKAMANLLYAAIMTRAGLPTSYGVGIYEYDRSQNAYNYVDVKVHIAKNRIGEFEKLAGVKLTKPITVQVN